MGNLEKFGIEITNPKPIYSPNDIIQGLVHYHVREKRAVEELKIKVYGEIATSVKLRRGRTAIPITNTHVFLNTECIVVDKFENNEIAAGVYSFPFAVRIENGNREPFPCSFESRKPGNHIRYSLIAKMKRPGLFNSNDTATEMLIVQPPIPVDAVVNAISPLAFEKQLTAGCCFWKTGFVDVKIQIDRSTFSGGETIPFQITAENNSGVDLKIKAYVEMTEIFTSEFLFARNTFETPVRETLLEKVVSQTCRSHQETYLITLPTFITQNTDFKKTHGMISVSYALVVQVRPGKFCSQDAFVRQPILINSMV